jgi:hypothetical protein
MKDYDIPLGVTAALISIVGIFANCVSLSYFIKQNKKGLGNKLLMLLNSCDLSVCVSTLTTAITHQLYLSKGNKAFETGYLITSFFYGISFDCTGFSTCLVSVTRTIKVCQPFFLIKGAWTSASFIAFLLFSFIREFICRYYVYIKPVNNIMNVRKYYSIIYSSGTAACTIAIVASSLLAAYWLSGKDRANGRISKNNRYATVTILILSAVFFALNTVFVSAALISFCVRLEVIEDSHYLLAYRDSVFSLSQCLNSIINPMIYLARKQEMRKFVLASWMTVKAKVSRLETKSGGNILQLTMRRHRDNLHQSYDNPDILLDDQI